MSRGAADATVPPDAAALAALFSTETGTGGPDQGATARFDDVFTDDAFLGGAIQLWQPRRGYRAATDPVLLAAATDVQPDERVLDVGSGAGAAAFCLAARAPGARLSGLERQAPYAALSRVNAARNGVDWTAYEGDVADPPAALREVMFDRVLTNPPFFAADAAAPLPDAAKDVAHREGASLAAWIDLCLRRLKPRGVLTVIQRVDRLDDLMSALAGRAGSIALAPLWPRVGAPAKRVIVRAVKDGRGPLTLTPGLVLHRDDSDGFTDAADAILRHAAPLAF